MTVRQCTVFACIFKPCRDDFLLRHRLGVVKAA